MKRAFTLLELLVVMGIMGLMGTIAVGGYRAMQRGMEERGVMQSVNSLIRAAYQRAQIDRQPTAVYFWNETLRSRSSEEHEIAVGRAVAVRRCGRLSDVQGTTLVDEFADLDLTYPVELSSASGSSSDPINLYPIEKLSQIQSGSSLLRSSVRPNVVKQSYSALVIAERTGDSNNGDNGTYQSFDTYGFSVVQKNGVDWQAGMAYGCEFMEIQLPHGYIFGSSYSTSAESPVKEAGTMVFDVGINTGNGITTGGTLGRKTIDIYSLRPDGASIKATKVASSDNPEERL